MKEAKSLEANLTERVASDLAALGYDVVHLRRMGGGPYPTLQILAERTDGKAMTVNDGALMTHELSRILDEHGESSERYTLEVSAPGDDRPLVRVKDYERFAGHVASVEVRVPDEDGPAKGRRFQGSIVRVTRPGDDAEVEFHTDAGDVRVALQSIVRAHLVYTGAHDRSGARSKH